MNIHFAAALKKHQADFKIDLNDSQISDLADYYDLVMAQNELRHLVAPCSPEVFAVRHLLESLTLLDFLPRDAKFADVGTGAGLPSIPCLIVRRDLKAVLIESKIKKADFLKEVLESCQLTERSIIYNRQFEEVVKPDVSFVTCRALDKFTQKLPRLLKWARGCNFLFFGGHSLRDELLKARLKFDEKLMPLSEQRFLFISKSKIS